MNQHKETIFCKLKKALSIDAIEIVQQAHAMKLDYTYNERLRRWILPTLSYRRQQDDMIEVVIKHQFVLPTHQITSNRKIELAGHSTTKRQSLIQTRSTKIVPSILGLRQFGTSF